MENVGDCQFPKVKRIQDVVPSNIKTNAHTFFATDFHQVWINDSLQLEGCLPYLKCSNRSVTNAGQLKIIAHVYVPKSFRSDPFYLVLVDRNH